VWNTPLLSKNIFEIFFEKMTELYASTAEKCDVFEGEDCIGVQRCFSEKLEDAKGLQEWLVLTCIHRRKCVESQKEHSSQED